MALIKCPECGKDISDKAVRCVNCGYELKNLNTTYMDNTNELNNGNTMYQNSNNISNSNMYPYSDNLRNDNPYPYSDNLRNDNLNGTVQNSFSQQDDYNLNGMSSDFKKKIIIIASIAFAIIVLAVVLGTTIHQKSAEKAAAAKAKKVEEEYMANYNLAVAEMFDGGLQAEKSCGLIHDVWSNCIFDESDVTTDKYTKGTDDFNVALGNLFLDSSFQSDIDDINKSKETVDGLMKELKNPPDKYDDAYDALQELYTEYTKMVKLATDPSGNLNSYTSEFNEADNDFVTAYDKVKIYLE